MNLVPNVVGDSISFLSRRRHQIPGLGLNSGSHRAQHQALVDEPRRLRQSVRSHSGFGVLNFGGFEKFTVTSFSSHTGLVCDSVTDRQGRGLLSCSVHHQALLLEALLLLLLLGPLLLLGVGLLLLLLLLPARRSCLC
jgi:hypothetical protein